MKDKMLFISSEIEKASLSKKDKSLTIAGYANTTAKDRAGDIVTADDFNTHLAADLADGDNDTLEGL